MSGMYDELKRPGRERRSREEDKIVKLPPCGDSDYSEDSDIPQIIAKAEEFLNTLYGHYLKEGKQEATKVVPTLPDITDSDDDISRDLGTPKVLKKYLRTEVSASRLETKENDIIASDHSEDIGIEETDEGTVNIHSVHFNPKDEIDGPSPVPLVMLHGLGGSAVAFHLNYSTLCEGREVFGVDLPGFGLSSREANLPSSKIHSGTEITKEIVLECEDRVIELLEKWRKAKGVNEMILLGHSFGGYIASVYAMKHRERVRHLVLVDPWGMMTKEETAGIESEKSVLKKNNFAIRLAMGLCKHWNLKPFDIPRAGGHTIGVLIMQVSVKKAQQDAYGKAAMEYFVDVNSRLPTGEKMFCILSGYSYIFPVLSLQSRFLEYSDCPHMTLIYGDNPMYTNIGGRVLQDHMPSKVTVAQVANSSHHVHAENPEDFHKVMTEVFRKVDAEET